MFFFIKSFSIQYIIPTKSELMELYGKLNINQFQIMDVCGEDVLGSGLYLAASIIGKKHALKK